MAVLAVEQEWQLMLNIGLYIMSEVQNFTDCLSRAALLVNDSENRISRLRCHDVHFPPQLTVLFDYHNRVEKH